MSERTRGRYPPSFPLPTQPAASLTTWATPGIAHSHTQLQHAQANTDVHAHTAGCPYRNSLAPQLLSRKKQWDHCQRTSRLTRCTTHTWPNLQRVKYACVRACAVYVCACAVSACIDLTFITRRINSFLEVLSTDSSIHMALAPLVCLRRANKLLCALHGQGKSMFTINIFLETLLFVCLSCFCHCLKTCISVYFSSVNSSQLLT